MVYTSVSLAYARVSPDEDATVTLWSVRGVAGLWPTKMVAEMVARNHFPTADPDSRYGRISFSLFVGVQ